MKQKKESLNITHPDLSQEWHPTKNGDLTPHEVTKGSSKVVWWKGSCGHEWESVIWRRTSGGRGCPYCSGQKVLKGFNDLASQHPRLAKEWHPTKNEGLSPEEVTKGSSKKVWWRCEAGHEWEALIRSRSQGNNCPHCSRRPVKKDSRPLTITYPEVATEWHPTKNGELTPQKVTYGSGKKVWWQCRQGHEWEAKVCNRTVRNSGCPICAKHQVVVGVNDFATIYPRLAAEWHPQKNGILTPQQVSKGQDISVWWQCQKGHEWKAMVNSRSQGNGCPTCAKEKQFLVSYDRSLAKGCPELMVEWHVEKNADLDPKTIGKSSAQMVWWKCQKGHEWESTVANRSKGRGCPYCANRRVLSGYNDLATVFPDLAKEWHPVKNGTLTPQMVSKKSSKLVWWLCEHGHEWEAQISNRSNGTGCPVCQRNKQ